ncbi:hypothetical protein PV749_01605 [Streptomyces sp. ID03-2B]|uniref:SUKH-4 immunity protein of toxin-antitoxin system n=1 Tax=Streptomyces caviscabies TaxID=90079 RepID=A0ABW2MLN3_9ACTN|nr:MULTISPECIES: hypothetical protein [unclassified Streptomyces]MCL6289190.1 hypothetical protein [Streptomyces sp. 43Y-GA-1]MDX3343592.1 hypothetical protein [Streptomyces sp. ME02-6979.5a]MDX3506357.1 hypothetical protein [Streptomyces sp. ATCC51928]MDX3589834.1 hypothetical protein [Streptomyces sp. ID03-2B]MDX5522204.1 hypothetical protein [Streptomyces sp. DE06-01C]
MESLIAAVREQEEAARFLAWPGDFDLGRGDHVEEVHLASGAVLEGFAGDGAGGTYFFCGEGGEERPILYADSEGGAALIAVGLPELMRLLLVVPWWRDCQAFTDEESRELEAEYLEDMPDLAARRDRAAASLGLGLPGQAEVLARLREVATRLAEDFVLIFTPEGHPYEPLFAPRDVPQAQATVRPC